MEQDRRSMYHAVLFQEVDSLAEGSAAGPFVLGYTVTNAISVELTRDVVYQFA